MKEKIKNQKATKARQESPFNKGAFSEAVLKGSLNSKFQLLTSDNKGITLLALIITIIIMLILVATTISITLNSGLFAKAAKASKDWNEADQNIQGEVDNIGNYIDSIVEEATGGTVNCTEHEWENGVCTKCGLKNNAPTISEVTLNTKTTNSFTVDVTATDVEETNLTYSLYISGENEPVATGTGNGTVTLEATNLGMYTDYTYYVTVTDNIETSTSGTNSVKTKCSGQTTTCATSECTTGSTVACTACNQTGTCATCGGDGERTCSTHTGRFVGGATLSCPKCGGGEMASMPSSCLTCGTSGRQKRCDSTGCGYFETTWSASIGYYDCTECSGSSGVCPSCEGIGNINTYCSHKFATSHNYCNHYENTEITEHLICDHSTDGAEHE